MTRRSVPAGAARKRYHSGPGPSPKAAALQVTTVPSGAGDGTEGVNDTETAACSPAVTEASATRQAPAGERDRKRVFIRYIQREKAGCTRSDVLFEFYRCGWRRPILSPGYSPAFDTVEHTATGLAEKLREFSWWRDGYMMAFREGWRYVRSFFCRPRADHARFSGKPRAVDRRGIGSVHGRRARSDGVGGGAKMRNGSAGHRGTTARRGGAGGAGEEGWNLLQHRGNRALPDGGFAGFGARGDDAHGAPVAQVGRADRLRALGRPGAPSRRGRGGRGVDPQLHCRHAPERGDACTRDGASRGQRGRAPAAGYRRRFGRLLDRIRQVRAGIVRGGFRPGARGGDRARAYRPGGTGGPGDGAHGRSAHR